jgi:putative tryptophan/tyrosine transport system substrate-binding protein
MWIKKYTFLQGGSFQKNGGNPEGECLYGKKIMIRGRESVGLASPFTWSQKKTKHPPKIRVFFRKSDTIRCSLLLPEIAVVLSMKNFFLLIIAAVVCLVRPAFAGSEVVVLQSSRLLPYEQARHGVEQVLAARLSSSGAKSIQPPEISLFVLSEEAELRLLKSGIESRKPQLVVAIGGKALAFAAALTTNTPVVYLLVPNPKQIIKGRGNVTGVEMIIPPARQLEGLAAVLPHAKRIGVLYDPEKTSGLITQARAGAAKLRIELVAEKTRSAKEVPELLAGLRGRIDAFWILPDLTVVTPHTLEKILLFSFAEKIPVLSFSGLEAGAAVTVTFDLIAMGERAGELAREILQGGNAGELAPVLPDKIKIELNRKVLKKLGSDYRPETVARPEPRS